MKKYNVKKRWILLILIIIIINILIFAGISINSLIKGDLLENTKEKYEQNIKSVSIFTPPTKTRYQKGEQLDLSGGELKITYNNDTVALISMLTEQGTVTEGITMSEVDNETQKTIRIYFNGVQATTDLRLEIIPDIDHQIKSVSIFTLPTKTRYQKGEQLDLSGGELKITYNNNTVALISMLTEQGTVTEGVTMSEVDNETQKTVRIYFNGVQATTDLRLEIIPGLSYVQNINGTQGITITGPKIGETNKNFVIPENINKIPVTQIGERAFAQPIEVETIEIPNSVTTIADNAFSGSENVIIVCNPGSTAEQYAKSHGIGYIYKGKTIRSIAVKTAPTKTSYFKNATSIDLAGGQVGVNYTDGTTSTLNMTSSGVQVSGFNSSTTGTKPITIDYEGNIETFNISIIEKSATEILIKSEPNKKTYTQNESQISLAGGEITVKYNDNTEETKSMDASGVTVTGFDSSSTGTKKITVTYQGKTAEFDIQVISNGSEDEGKVVLGDINGNGKVDVTDLLLIKRHIIAQGKKEWILVDDKFKAGDMNSDNKINATDLLLLKRKIVNM